MKKCLSILCFLFLSVAANSEGFYDAILDYSSHINFTLGYFTPINSSIEGSTGAYVCLLTDDLTYDYYFSFDQSENTTLNEMLPFGFSLRIPVFYNDLLSTGLGFTGGYSTKSIIELLMGGYFDINISSFSFIATGGMSFASSTLNLGSIPSQFSGDPGFYQNGVFYEPGTPVYMTGVSGLGYGFGLGIKYNIFKYLYVECTYTYLSALTIKDYVLAFSNEKEFPNIPQPDPVTLSAASTLLIGIGFGI